MPDLRLPASYHSRPGYLKYNRGPNPGFWYDSVAARMEISRVRTPEDHGAVGNGTTDDTTALLNLRDAMGAGEIAYFAPGKVYRFANALDHYYWNNKDNVTLYGPNSRIHATVPAESGLQFESSDNVWIEGLTLSTDLSGLPLPPNAGSRGNTTHHQRLTFWNCDSPVIRDVTIDGSYAGGIYLWRANNFVMERPIVSYTRADGIHITGPSSNGLVKDWRTYHIGDDMVAVISYAADGAACENIHITGGIGGGQYHGRGITVVGGKRIRYIGNKIMNSRAAGAYIFVETGDFVTNGVEDVILAGNEFIGCSQAGSVEGHPAILIGNWATDGKVCTKVKFLYNTIFDVPGPKLPMRLEGSASSPVTLIEAFGNQIYGSFSAGPHDGWIDRTNTNVAWPDVTGEGSSNGVSNIPTNRVRAF